MRTALANGPAASSGARPCLALCRFVIQSPSRCAELLCVRRADWLAARSELGVFADWPESQWAPQGVRPFLYPDSDDRGATERLRKDNLSLLAAGSFSETIHEPNAKIATEERNAAASADGPGVIRGGGSALLQAGLWHRSGV